MIGFDKEPIGLDQGWFRPWLSRFVKLLYALPVYCITRALFDWKTLSQPIHPWSTWVGIVIQGLFFTLFLSLTTASVAVKRRKPQT